MPTYVVTTLSPTYAKASSVSTKSVAQVLASDHFLDTFLVQLNFDELGSTHFGTRLIVGGNLTEYSDDVTTVLIPKVISDEEWANFKALEGTWANEAIDENWLDDLRTGWNDELRDLYGPEWD